MKAFRNARGFHGFEHPGYPDDTKLVRVVQESSCIGEYEDAWGKPGSSFLWVGDHLHLNREEIAELVEHLQRWLKTGGFAR